MAAFTPRRILMVAPTSFFADYGCHVRILEEARVLAAMGHQLRIVTYHNGGTPAGLDVKRTWTIPWRQDYEVGSSRHKLAFDVLLGGTVLAEALRWRPDIVHGHLHEGALIGAAAARTLGVPLVFDYQGSLTSEMADHGFLNPDGPYFRPVRRLETMIDHLADLILTSSHHAEAQLLRDFGLPAARLLPLPDCVNAEVFKPGLLGEGERARALAALGIPAERRIVVYLGLLAAHQGTHLLIQAARRVVDRRPDSHFLVMGFPGTEVFATQASALGLDGHMTFTGRVPYDLAPRHLALGDVAVAPKISTSEGSGKLLNYMAMGLATVAFDTPVSREYLLDDGCYAPIGDARALADALLAQLERPDEAVRRGRRLRDRALRDYSWQRAGELLSESYDRLIHARRHSRPLVAVPAEPEVDGASLGRPFPT